MSDSAAGHILFLLIHSMLLLPSELLRPCLDNICDVLHGIDALSKISSAVEVLDKQEEAWPKNGNDCDEYAETVYNINI